MKFQCHKCKCPEFRMSGSRFSNYVLVTCAECGESVAEFSQMDFIEEVE